MNFFNAPNSVTFTRVIFCLVIVASVLYASPIFQLFNPLLLAFIYSLDALDGYLARTYNQETFVGALFDIAADHLIELLLLIVLAKIDLVPFWVVVFFLVRIILIDTIRATSDVEPFKKKMRHLSHYLVSSRLMRVLYSVIKAMTFFLLLLIQPLSALFPTFFSAYGQHFLMTASILLYLSVFLCALRGVPVVVEFLLSQKSHSTNV